MGFTDGYWCVVRREAYCSTWLGALLMPKPRRTVGLALVKRHIVSAEYARAALAALNEEVDTCGGCEIVLKSDRAESLARYFDAPLPDEPDRDWRPADSPPPIELPGAAGIRGASETRGAGVPSSTPASDSPPTDP